MKFVIYYEYYYTMDALCSDIIKYISQYLSIDDLKNLNIVYKTFYNLKLLNETYQIVYSDKQEIYLENVIYFYSSYNIPDTIKKVVFDNKITNLKLPNMGNNLTHITIETEVSGMFVIPMNVIYLSTRIFKNLQLHNKLKTFILNLNRRDIDIVNLDFLPDFLEHLEIKSEYLLEVNFSQCTKLKYISLTEVWTNTLNINKELEVLIFEREHSLIKEIFPDLTALKDSNLKKLVLHYFHEGPINFIPASLKSLVLGNFYNLPLEDVLPVGLEELTIGSYFEHSFAPLKNTNLVYLKLLTSRLPKKEHLPKTLKTICSNSDDIKKLLALEIPHIIFVYYESQNYTTIKNLTGATRYILQNRSSYLELSPDFIKKIEFSEEPQKHVIKYNIKKNYFVYEEPDIDRITFLSIPNTSLIIDEINKYGLNY